ncbi:hypothetical protein OAK49_02455 [Euryarchaeota archaeon]|nr:hypothetical protein [Euryarchaeota archaeon]
MAMGGPDHGKINTVISAWLCIAIGSAIVLYSGSSPFSLALAAPISIAGVILLVIGIGMKNEDSVDHKIINNWEPESDLLPDAGGPMYRIDTTLVEPIRTSVLCGRCGNVHWSDGGRPHSFVCPICEIELWRDEEE